MQAGSPTRPLRIPSTINIGLSDPDHAEAGQKGSWKLRFVLSRNVGPEERLWLYLHGGRNLKPSLDGLQTRDPEAEGYVTLTLESSEPLHVVGESEGAGVISFMVPQRGLKKGETLVAILKDVTMPPLSHPERFFVLMTASCVDELKTPNLWVNEVSRIVGACRLPIVGGKPYSIRAIAPSISAPSQRVSILVRPEDLHRNTAKTHPGNLSIDKDGKTFPAEQIQVEGTTCVRVTSPQLGRGVNRLVIRDSLTSASSQSNPILCRESQYQLLWGLLHGHTEVSDGVGSLERYFRHMRDECGLDFGASSEHDNAQETTDDLWHVVQETVARFNQPGRFTTFLGYEWAKWRKLGYGDRNVYYLHDFRPMYRSDEGHYPTPPELFQALKDEHALVIPHHPAHPGNHNDWTYHDPQKERLVEIYSIWGCSERAPEEGNPLPGKPQFRQETPPMNPLGYVQRALALGWRVGFTADHDDHLNHMGDRTIRARGSTGGLTGVWARENTREAIWEALWNRRCYGTTGERIILDFSINGFPMGSELDVSSQPDLFSERKISIIVHGTSAISRIEIVRNNIEVEVIALNTLDCEMEWIDNAPLSEINLPATLHSREPFTFYYLRVYQEDGCIAWASPIWIV